MRPHKPVLAEWTSETSPSLFLPARDAMGQFNKFPQASEMAALRNIL